MRYFLCWVILLSLTACDSSTSKVSEKITQQFQASGRTFVDLSEALPSSWERVCVLGPYSDNQAATKTLGFDWDVESMTSIPSNDGIALLIFVRGNKVVEYVEQSRRDGDFTNLGRTCFLREKATFTHHSNPPKGWPGLFPKE